MRLLIPLLLTLLSCSPTYQLTTTVYQATNIDPLMYEVLEAQDYTFPEMVGTAYDTVQHHLIGPTSKDLTLLDRQIGIYQQQAHTYEELSEAAYQQNPTFRNLFWAEFQKYYKPTHNTTKLSKK
jgi:hypothetical protein